MRLLRHYSEAETELATGDSIGGLGQAQAIDSAIDGATSNPTKFAKSDKFIGTYGCGYYRLTGASRER